MTQQRLQARIVEKTRVAQDIYQFVLEPAADTALSPFGAGAHIDVHIDNRTVRQYSLLNGPDERDHLRIGVLRDADGRGGSMRLCDGFDAGDRLTIGQPRNCFELRPAAHYILVAGGIGITPISAMALELAVQGASFELHYLVRSTQRAAFREPLEQHLGTRLTLHVGEPGRALSIDRLLQQAPPGAELYVCGPHGLIRALETGARQLGWGPERIHYELFAPTEVTTDGTDRSFEIRVVGSDRVVPVGADETALEALLGAGFEVPCSCEQGVCGSCVLEVVDGIPDHRDLFLTDAERADNRHFTPCCSRALSPGLTVVIPAHEP